MEIKWESVKAKRELKCISITPFFIFHEDTFFPLKVSNDFRSSGRADYPAALCPGFGRKARSMSDDAAPRNVPLCKDARLWGLPRKGKRSTNLIP